MDMYQYFVFVVVYLLCSKSLYLYLIKLIHNDYNKCLTECNNFLIFINLYVNLQLKNLNYLFRNFSASRAAIQPVPAAVTACL